ncbi:hypothetical protein WMY93_033049 [Mugilogobius chulae]|uniref:Uncharacterized protein n=1 Tax=Mugilogobius chulae TaxID=88201 RepID=A0AAW0MJ30_9GOBI
MRNKEKGRKRGQKEFARSKENMRKTERRSVYEYAQSKEKMRKRERRSVYVYARSKEKMKKTEREGAHFTLRTHRLLSKKQNQAARKILRFLLRCRHSPMLDHRPLKQSALSDRTEPPDCLEQGSVQQCWASRVRGATRRRKRRIKGQRAEKGQETPSPAPPLPLVLSLELNTAQTHLRDRRKSSSRFSLRLLEYILNESATFWIQENKREKVEFCRCCIEDGFSERRKADQRKYI